MQTKAILLLGFLLFVIFANAQIESVLNIEELLNCNVINSSVSIQTNQAFIKQTGEGNEMIAIQQQEGLINNSVLVMQQGTDNSGYIKQVGSAHITKLIQDGVGNEANLWSFGDKTIGFAYQSGNGNVINSFIDNRGFIPKSTLLLQEGDNNSIEIALLGNGFLSESWPKAAVIQQKGNELQVIAKLDSYRSPIYIEQQSGLTGGGMKINISNSDFNFPMK